MLFLTAANIRLQVCLVPRPPHSKRSQNWDGKGPGTTLRQPTSCHHRIHWPNRATSNVCSARFTRTPTQITVLVGCICLVGSWVLDAVRGATLDHVKQHKACGSGLSIQLYAYGFRTWVAPLADWSQWCSMEARLVNHLQMVGVGSVKSFGGQNRGLTRPYGPADQFPHCTWLL